MTDITDIIAEIESYSKPGGSIDLLRWIDKYPSYREEIIEYAILKHNEPFLETEPVGDPQYDFYSVRANQILQNALGNREEQGSVNDASLFSLIRRKNKRPEDVARSLKVGFSVLAKLDHGLLEASSIPRRFWRMLYREINKPEGMFEAHLIGTLHFLSPRLGNEPKSVFDALFESPRKRSIEFYSKSKPHSKSLVSFSSAIKECEDMSDEEKSNWLKILSEDTSIKDHE